MSPFLLQIFAFMLSTLLLGFLLGWAIWRYGQPAEPEMTPSETEAEFWKNKHEITKNELLSEQVALTSMREENEALKAAITKSRK